MIQEAAAVGWVETIHSRLGEHASLRALLEALRRDARSVSLAGLNPTAKALVAVFLTRELDRPMILITDSNETADRMAQTIACFLGSRRGENSEVVTLPAFDCHPYEGRSPHPEITETRAVTLWKLASGHARIVTVPLSAALVRLQRSSVYRSLGLELQQGDEVNLDDLEEHLLGSSYQRVEPVETVGEFSLRGGIVDVFPPESKWPVRLEFLGDRIESIREFEPSSQRSRQVISQTLLLPLTEQPATPAFFAQLSTSLQKQPASKIRRGMDEEAWETCAQPFPGWEFYMGLVNPGSDFLFSLLPGALVLWDEPAERDKQLYEFSNLLTEAYDEVRDSVPPPPRAETLFWTPEEFRSALEAQSCLHLKELTLEGDSTTSHYVLHSQPPPKFHGQMKNLATEVKRWRPQGGEILLAVPSQGQADRLGEILHEYNLSYSLDLDGAPNRAATASADPDVPAGIRIIQSELTEGVILPELNLRVLSEEDLFGMLRLIKPTWREKTRLTSFVSDLRDLKIGDYVVHVDHGIGIYRGLKQITHEGMVRDFMLITFHEEAKLYVPLERLDLIQKYRSSGVGKPTLDRLGGGTWTRTKTRVKRALREMSQELLNLYAQRKMAATTSFGPDSEWQREFEGSFEFEETPDQLTAIRDIKRDLESGQPMDRLLCGDVGYGKTEVATRAAFKVVQESKQVAVLTPTTVLAFQHYNTFRQRFAAFPVRIDMLSRFRSPAQQKKTIQETENGQTDILIGTHRMFSQDVKFRDLGLLIIDEEQRFGVRHKEKLKKLGAGVHVLTLSATPIPRTLNMSLGGLQDLSLMETPPKDRLAIQTMVAPFSEGLLQSAILAELDRQGQTYFLHNRVESIYSMAALVQRLVPTARVAVAHGQMSEKELEKVMLRFVEHQADVLVSTAIIENGLDIPRVNTILINRADRFGLSDLYQLRGRVGRSNRRAYAYLLIPAEATLTPGARRRLAALKEFSDLGSGFRLAALDLELRGAGNLLGAEQHGHLNAVGIDLYLQMLEQTVGELKGQLPQPDLRAQLNLGLDIRIPSSYIAEEGQRLRMYKRISSLSAPEERDRFAEELQDRFGPHPPSVCNLLDYAALKALAEQLQVKSIEQKDNKVSIRFHPQAQIDPQKLIHWVRRAKGSSLRPSGLVAFPLGEKANSVTEAIRAVLLELQA